MYTPLMVLIGFRSRSPMKCLVAKSNSLDIASSFIKWLVSIKMIFVY